MKKATLTFGLFSLVVLTSFTQLSGNTGGSGGTTTTTTSGGSNGTGTGNQDLGGNKKLDHITILPVALQNKNQDIISRDKSDN